MGKEFKVFFSWQSDLSANKTTKLIEESIAKARDLLSDRVDLIIDEATRNKLGSPDIVITLLEKIRDCDLFIADVSIVGEYISPNEKDEDEAKPNLFPNPNVMLELGYAAGSIGWERCICIANSDFGDINQLPFDLNHRRITNISYSAENMTRSKRIEETARIIADTVCEYIENPRPKEGFAHHIIGGYAFETTEVIQSLIPYNPIAFQKFNAKNDEIRAQCYKLIEIISGIHISAKEAHPADNAVLQPETENKDLEAITKYVLKPTRVVVKEKELSDSIKQFSPCDLSQDFFDVGNLKVASIALPHSSPEYYGTEEEKTKYKYIRKLKSKLTELEFRAVYAKTFDNICILPLAIKNISDRVDSNLTVHIEITQGQPLYPNASVINPEIAELAGYVKEDGMIDEILSLPDNKDIHHAPQPIHAPEAPLYPNILRIDGFGYAVEPDPTKEDYEYALQDYIQVIDEGTDNQYTFYVQSIRSNEILWLEKAILIQPIDGNIVVNYSIKSNNTKGDLSGTLSLK